MVKSSCRLSTFQLWPHPLWSGTLIHVLLPQTALWLHTSCSFISPLICFLTDRLTLCYSCLFPCSGFALISAFLRSLLLLRRFCHSSLLSSFGFIFCFAWSLGWPFLSSLALFVLYSVMFLQFLPKTHLFFTAGKDKKIKQWDADKFEHIQTLEVWRSSPYPW